MACTTKSKFVDQLRFLASGQNDPQSIALAKAADEIEYLFNALKEMSKLCDETHAAEQSALSEIERLRKGLERIADLQTSDEDGVNKYIVILAIGMAHETLVRREIDD